MKRLLLVDDDPYAQKMLEDLFRKEWQILSETGKDQIVKRFKQDPVDLVILNAAIRRTDGEATFQVIRETLPDIPVIVCSPSNNVKLGRELVARGAFWNLTTPMNTIDLEHVMRIAMQVEEHRQRARDTHRDFAHLEAGIARLSLPQADAPTPGNFTFEQDELIQGIVDLFADILQVERVSLMLLNPATGELRIKAAKGLHPKVISTTVKRLGEGIAGTVARDGKPLFVRDVGRDEKFSESPFYDQLTTKSLICVPLKIGDQVVGVLNANNKKSGEAFEEHELYLATIFSHILLMTLLNAQAHHDRERFLEREVLLGQLYRQISGVSDLKALLNTLLENCCKIFGAEGGMFCLLSEKGDGVTAFTYAAGNLTETELTASLAKTWKESRTGTRVLGEAECRKFMLLPGVVKDARSWVSVPVLLKNRPIGSLELGSASRDRFLNGDARSIELIGHHAALGIHNARLYEKLLVSIQEISEARKEVDRVRRNQFL